MVDTILIVVGSLIALCVALGTGYIMGAGHRHVLDTMSDMQKRLEGFKELEPVVIPIQSGVVDSSPGHIKEKRDARRRRGEEEIEPGSQIIETKGFRRQQEEISTAREEALDKWMPGAVNAKSRTTTR